MVLANCIDILDELKSLDFFSFFLFFFFSCDLYIQKFSLITHVIKWLEIPADYGDIPEYF